VQNIEYGRIFSEISNGYSHVTIDDGDYFFKHPNQIENFCIYDRYSIIYEFARAKGIQTEEEKVQVAIDGGWWAEATESQIASLRSLISTLKQTKEKLLYPSQKQEIEKQ
jgi:hypothetical protein